MSTPKEKKKSPLRFIVLGIVLLIAAYFGYKKIKFAFTHETTDDAQVETMMVPVLPRVAGYVKYLDVNDYDSVKTGQLVVELDDAELQMQLLQMEADLKVAEADYASAKASLGNSQESLKVNTGNIAINDVKLQKATDDYNRDKNLYEANAITKRQLDDSKYNYETTIKQLENSRNDLSVGKTRVGMMETAIQKAAAAIDVKKAMIEQQKLKISYTKVYAPTSGKIGRKSISIGQYVQAGAPLFTVVNDTTYWVVANFKENQIQKLRPGMEVDIEVDAYPDLKMKGYIENLSEATGARFALLPPDNSSGNFVKITQRIPIKIGIKDVNTYRKVLRAGLSVYVVIPV